jgi:hypothetical protein
MGCSNQRRDSAMTSAKTKKKAEAGTTPPATKSAAPEWVVSMHEYHSRTGLYRAEDLDRVLGDPREQVGGETTGGPAISCRPSDED